MNTLNKYITLPHKKTAVLRPQGSPKSEPTQFILIIVVCYDLVNSA